MSALVSDKFTVHGDIVIDTDEWAAQCLVADRATSGTVAEMVAAQLRRDADERRNSVQVLDMWAAD